MYKKRAGTLIGTFAPDSNTAFVQFVRDLLVFSLMASLSCAIATGTSDRPDSRDRTAVIYEGDGEKGAVRVVVKLFDFCSAGNKPAGIFITDDCGRYSIADMPYGIYRLWAEKDSLVLFQDSVVIASSHTNLRDDTLESPSSMTGIVSLQPCHDPRTVTIRVIGTGKQCSVIDVEGRFTLTGMAGGNYSLLVESTLPDYIPASRTVLIANRPHDTLADTFSLFYTGIPVVTGIRIVQDTLAGAITVSWDKTDYANLHDYLLYRDTGSAGVFSEEPFAATGDTFFIDSLNCLNATDSLDAAERSLKYRVAVRDRMQQIGPTWQQVAITFAPAVSAATFFSHRIRYAVEECDSASVGDTIMLMIAARNPTRPLRSLVWYDSPGRDTIAWKLAADTAAKEFVDTLRYALDSAGVNSLLAVVTDDRGMKWFDTIPVRIVTDAPDADAGRDTGVFYGDTVVLHGSATQRFGEIVEWRWKIASGQWATTAGPDTFTIASFAGEKTVCSLSVIDDDGNRDADEITITAFARVQSIAASNDQSLLLTADGSLWACGSNTYGQLGDGTRTNRSLPVQVMNDVRRMSAGYYHTLILTTDGTLLACGNNDFGELGDGMHEHRLRPVRIMIEVKSMAAGYYHSLILMNDSTLRVCGHDCCGPAGDSVIHDYPSPVPVMSGVERVAEGRYHSLILKTDRTLWTCGRNQFGQLGDGTTEDRPSPVRVMDDVVNIAAGESHSLMVRTDGTLWACGGNEFGQLGDGTTIDRPVPVKVTDSVVNIAAGHGHSLIVKTDGTLWACGWNDAGQLGDGTTKNRSQPVRIMTDARAMAAGYHHSLILNNDGSLWACGNNVFGQLGDGTRENRPTPRRIRLTTCAESK